MNGLLFSSLSDRDEALYAALEKANSVPFNVNYVRRGSGGNSQATHFESRYEILRVREIVTEVQRAFIRTINQEDVSYKRLQQSRTIFDDWHSYLNTVDRFNTRQTLRWTFQSIVGSSTAEEWSELAERTL